MSNTLIGPIKGLGTLWHVEFFAVLGEQKRGEIEKRLKEIIGQFDDDYSRFNKDSFVGRLNETREIEDPPHDLVQMLTKSLEMYKKTDGVFNITAGGVLESKGYGQGGARFGNPTEMISISPERIALLGEGRIDLGGIGKGFLIDKIANILRGDFEQEYFIVNGGGDIYLTSDRGKEIELVLQHPTEREKMVGVLLLKNQAFAASSPYVRKWKDKDGVEQQHLVVRDNLHKEPNKKPQPCYVVAGSAMEADAWATTLSLHVKEQLMPEEIKTAIIAGDKLLADRNFHRLLKSMK